VARKVIQIFPFSFYLNSWNIASISIGLITKKGMSACPEKIDNFIAKQNG